METRRLGKTEHQSTVVTFGTIAFGRVAQDEADQAIEYALGRGINHFDVAPSYAEAEQRLGSYLKRHPQPELFVSCKTAVRERDGAREELHRTLERLGRDRFDLYQLHSVGDLPTLDAVFAPGGAFEAILEAREQGLVGHVGITGHGMQSPATHAEALRRFPFSTVMTSCNLYLYQVPDFRRDWDALVASCQADDVGMHVLKATAKASWDGRTPTHGTWYEPFTAQTDIDRAVAWVLHQPVTTLCSAGDFSVFPAIVDAAERYRDVATAAQLSLLASAPDYGNIFEPATI